MQLSPLKSFVAATLVTFAVSFAAGFLISEQRLVTVAREALAADVFAWRPGIAEETFGECVLLTTQWLRQADPLRDALESRWVRPGPENLHPCKMLSIMLGVTPGEVAFAAPEVYYQYAFGPRYLMAIGLSVLDIAGLRLAYEILSYAAVLALLLAAWRAAPDRALVFLPVPLVLLLAFAQHGYAHNLLAAPQFIVLFLALAAMLALRRWFAPLRRRLGLMAALGAFAWYLEASFAIPFVLGLVLVVNHLFFVKGARPYGREAVVQGAAIVGTLAGAFLLSIGLRLLLMQYLHGVGFGYFVAATATRMAATADGVPIGLWDVAWRLARWSGQLTGGLSTAAVLLAASLAAWVVALVVAARDPRRDLVVDLCVLAVASAGVVAWYPLFLNHTYIHAFFMVRNLALPIACGFVALALALRAQMGAGSASAASATGSGVGSFTRNHTT